VSRIDPKTIRFCIPTLIIASPAMSRRIGKLLQSPSLAPEKLDELQRKNNILSAFVHRKFDEAADALSDASLDDVEEAVRHATASVKVAAGQATDRVKQEL
jgi:protein disulfide-isomerase A6